MEKNEEKVIVLEDMVGPEPSPILIDQEKNNLLMELEIMNIFIHYSETTSFKFMALMVQLIKIARKKPCT